MSQQVLLSILLDIEKDPIPDFDIAVLQRMAAVCGEIGPQIARALEGMQRFSFLELCEHIAQKNVTPVYPPPDPAPWEAKAFIIGSIAFGAVSRWAVPKIYRKIRTPTRLRSLRSRRALDSTLRRIEVAAPLQITDDTTDRGLHDTFDVAITFSPTEDTTKRVSNDPDKVATVLLITGDQIDTGVHDLSGVAVTHSVASDRKPYDLSCPSLVTNAAFTLSPEDMRQLRPSSESKDPDKRRKISPEKQLPKLVKRKYERDNDEKKSPASSNYSKDSKRSRRGYKG